MSARADYDWDLDKVLEDHRATTIISITDLDLGNMSVTNDVENVLIEISEQLPDDNPLSENAVIYRDSCGFWDEIVLDQVGNFQRFAALPRDKDLNDLKIEAVIRLIKRQVGAKT